MIKNLKTNRSGSTVSYFSSVVEFLRKYHEQLFLFFLGLLIVSLPLSRFGLSVGQFGLLGIWLITGDLKNKFRAFFNNKAALVVSSIFLLHVAGLIYTTDFSYAFNDLRIKLPLLFLPVLFVSVSYIDKRKLHFMLRIYIAAVFVSTLYSLRINLVENVSDFRELSPLISHIRLSLNICLAFFFSLYFFYRHRKERIILPVIYALFALWFLLSLIMMESVQGIIIVLVVITVVAAYRILLFNSWPLKLTGILVMALFYAISFQYIKGEMSAYFIPETRNFNQLDERTSTGNLYYHDTTSQFVENGSLVYLYVNYPELRESWNKRSSLDFDSLDTKGQSLKTTLIRYLNSKGLRKDSENVRQLTKEDISNIEKGIANVLYTRKFSLRSRLYKIFWEYQAHRSGLNPGGHTMLQRLEYWKTSQRIITDNFLIGVGTGDIAESFNNKYIEMNSALPKHLRNRAHNQYITIFIGFGLLGFLWFLFTLVYPAVKQKKFSAFLYFSFWLTMIISMLIEDTLETQMGVTLFAFFNSFLLFSPVLSKSTDP